MKTERVLIADDHAIVRAGLRTIIRDIRPFAHFDEAANGKDVIELVKNNHHDMIILDIIMPETDPIEMLRNVFALRENSRVLIYSMKSEDLYANRFLQLGVLGYLNKESPPEEIKKAITNVVNGNMYISPNLKKHLYEDVLAKRTDNPFERLSNRELQIATYLLKGYSHAEIKAALNLHSSTVGTLRIRLFEKLKIKNLVELGELAKLYQIDFSGL